MDDPDTRSAGDAPPLIELDGVSWRQGGRNVLSDVSWAVRAGERWAVLGPNGAGKSSLLKIACGYAWPTGGVVRRLGRECVDLIGLRRSIGWVSPELARQIPPLEMAVDTVLSGAFAQTGLKRFGRDADDVELLADAVRVLDDCGGGELQGRPFGVLSHGERQVVLIARARMARPMLIVLDEPCGGMDPGAKERFLAWLGGFVDGSPETAVLLVTHHVEEILPAFDRTLLIAGGRVANVGATADVVTTESLSRTYGAGWSFSRSVDDLATPISGGDFWPRTAAILTLTPDGMKTIRPMIDNPPEEGGGGGGSARIHALNASPPAYNAGV